MLGDYPCVAQTSGMGQLTGTGTRTSNPAHLDEPLGAGAGLPVDELGLLHLSLQAILDPLAPLLLRVKHELHT